MSRLTRTYHAVAINETTGRKTYMTATPVTHREGCTILSKIPREGKARKSVRYQLEEVSKATTECDGCGKERRDVRSVGRDANGDPDAPDLCFLCRKKYSYRGLRRE